MDLTYNDNNKDNSMFVHDKQASYNPEKIDINRKQKLQELFAYGESVAAKNNFTEEDVINEIKKYRNNQ
jgi:hypothetical protein